MLKTCYYGFKPCYKWNTFNTIAGFPAAVTALCSFKPCYKWNTFNTGIAVLFWSLVCLGFKPCYKWNTFNTDTIDTVEFVKSKVLNLVISGIPSIQSRC